MKLVAQPCFEFGGQLKTRRGDKTAVLAALVFKLLEMTTVGSLH